MSKTTMGDMSKKRELRPKPVSGHKCEGAKLYVSVHCQCGWTSGKWSASCRGSAYAEWRYHVERWSTVLLRCTAIKPELGPLYYAERA